MTPRQHLALAALGLASAVTSQVSAVGFPSRYLPLHSQATVNDARSHGVVGDKFLSLAETIMLTNRVLDENALSAEERAQLGGFGNDIAFCEIDTTVAPVLTLERDLPIIEDSTHGFVVVGANGRATIELGDTRGFVTRSNFVDFNNLLLRGGEQAIQIEQTDTLFGSLIENVQFENQSVAAIRVILRSPNGSSRVQIADNVFRNVPVAVAFDDVGLNRNGTLELIQDNVIDGCDVGVLLRLGSGGSTQLYMESLSMMNCRRGFVVERVAQDRGLLAELRNITIDADRAMILDAGRGSATMNVIAEMLDLKGTTSALETGPLDGPFQLALRDSRIDGPVQLLTGRTTPIRVENTILSGSATVGSTGANVSFDSCVLESLAMSTVGSQPVQIQDSSLTGGSLTANASAPASVDGSFISGTTISPNVTVTNALPADPLGTCDAVPLNPTIGSTLTLTTDLPTGVNGWWLFGPRIEFPQPINGLRAYADLSRSALIPAPVTGVSQTPVPIPSSPALRGFDLVFHLAVTPNGNAGAPSLWLPPARRVRIQ